MKFDDERCAQNLMEMVRYQTLSHADPEKMDLKVFFSFHDFLERKYPLVHKHLKKELVGKAGLLYTWKGAGTSPWGPLLLIGHQDIVPAGDPKGWKYPADGAMAEGRVWGRGANDCKSVILGHMEAVEALLAAGFTPKTDVYLGYGYNEETGSDQNSAAMICEVLRKRNIHPGLVIDEGAGVCDGAGEGICGKIAYIKLGEKGYADYKITIRDKGGHSMAPGKFSPVAEMGQIAVDLMRAPFPYRVIDCIAEEYRIKAPHIKENGEAYMDIAANLPELLPELEKNPRTLSKFHTTLALTMIRASDQANVLPTEVSMVVNCRLLSGDTVESIKEQIEGIVNGRACVEVLKGIEATPISRTSERGYQCMKSVIEEMWEDVLVIPSMTVGGTDAKYYYPICDCVCRFSGFPEDGVPINMHTFNESMPIKNCGKGPEFFARLIQKYGEL